MKEPLIGWLRKGRFVLPLLIALVAAAAFACGGDSRQVTVSEYQVFRQRIAADPGTFDPQLASVGEEISVVKQLFRGLFTYDKDLNVVAAVAVELPTKENGGISDDGLTYTIKLREEATWSDGRRVTAHDFVYAFQRLFDPQAGAQGRYFSLYTAIKGADEASQGAGSIEDVGVSALDDSTLQFQLVRQQPTLTTLLALWPASPLRQDVVQQPGASWTEAGKLIGNGPFVLKEYAPEQQVVLEANANYWGDDQPSLDRLVYRIIPEDSAALIAYESGEVDMTLVPPPDIAGFQDSEELLQFAQLETYAIHYNHRQEPFDDPLVRQAFSRAIDRDAYVLAVQQGAGAPALGWLPPSMPGSNADVGQDLDFDPEAAQALLSVAGYPDGEDFPSVTLMINQVASSRRTAEFLKEQLKTNLGVDLQVEALEEETYFDRLLAGDFDATWLSWFADYADPENWLPQQFGTDGGFNVLGYSNPDVDELFTTAATELNQTERLALYDQAHRLIIEDQAVTPLYYPQRHYLVKPHVAGLVTTVLDAEPGDWFVTSVRIMQTEGGGAPPASEPDN